MVAAGRALGAEAWGRRGGQCRPKAGSPVVSGSQRLAWWWLAQHRCSRDGGWGGGHPAPHCDVAASASYSLLGLLSKPARCGRLENKVEEREGRSVSFRCFSCQASPLLYYY